MAPNIKEKAKMIKIVKNPKSNTVKYFDNRIFILLNGRIRRSFIVPQLNSFATIPAAIIIVNKPARLSSWILSATKSHAEYSTFVLKLCVILYSFIAISFV